MKIIDEFQGEYRFLSNFWMCDIKYEGITYTSSEAAYQAAKSLDSRVREAFTTVMPGKSKRMGSSVELREDWEEVKLQVMEVIVREKFWHNPELKQKLTDTGDAFLIEGNTWGDKFWGCTYTKSDPRWEGANHLGVILMQIRSEF